MLFHSSYFLLPPHKTCRLHRQIQRPNLDVLTWFLRKWVVYTRKFPPEVPAGNVTLSLDHSRDEPVSSPCDGLHEAWPFRIVLEHTANLADRGVDAIVGVKKNVPTPDSLDDLFAGDQLPIFSLSREAADP